MFAGHQRHRVERNVLQRIQTLTSPLECPREPWPSHSHDAVDDAAGCAGRGSDVVFPASSYPGVGQEGWPTPSPIPVISFTVLCVRVCVSIDAPDTPTPKPDQFPTASRNRDRVGEMKVSA